MGSTSRLVTNSENKKNMSLIRSNKIGYNGIAIDGNSYRVHWSENGIGRSKRIAMSHENALELAINFRKQKEKENGYISN